ncbi:MAG: DUF2255 family protein [Caldilineaceae bacterium]
MAAWTENELARVGTAEELEIAPYRPDGTLRNPVPIWVVRAGSNLYVRSYKGQGGAWFRAVLASHVGQIRAAGLEKEVTFVAESDPGINDQVDTAYRTKYGRYPQYVAPMLTPEVRATTIKLVPSAAGR